MADVYQRKTYPLVDDPEQIARALKYQNLKTIHRSILIAPNVDSSVEYPGLDRWSRLQRDLHSLLVGTKGKLTTNIMSSDLIIDSHSVAAGVELPDYSPLLHLDRTVEMGMAHSIRVRIDRDQFVIAEYPTLNYEGYMSRRTRSANKVRECSHWANWNLIVASGSEKELNRVAVIVAMHEKMESIDRAVSI